MRTRVPKIIFRYSSIYDELRREKLKQKLPDYPSPKKILNFKQRVEKLWKRKGVKILKELSKISGLKWEEKEIDCYLVGGGISFSDPLTVSISKLSAKEFLKTLTHELIHRLFCQRQNRKRCKKAWQWIWRRYKKESPITKIHIPLFAIYSLFLLKFYGKKELKERAQKNKKLHLEKKRLFESLGNRPNTRAFENIGKVQKEIFRVKFHVQIYSKKKKTLKRPGEFNRNQFKDRLTIYTIVQMGNYH